MPKAERPKRVSKSISLPPHIADRLAKEAESRLINESLLVERALVAFFENLPSTDGASPAPAATAASPPQK